MILHPTQHIIRRFRDILLRQSLGIVLKKLNLTQQKWSSRQSSQLRWCLLERTAIKSNHHTPHTTTILRPFFRDHPGEPVPEANFWTLWCKGRLTEADTPTIQLGATPSGLGSSHLHHSPCFSHAGYPSCRPTNSVKALKARQKATNKTNYNRSCHYTNKQSQVSGGMYHFTNSTDGRGSSWKYESCIAASDVMRFVGSIVSIFCNCLQRRWYFHLTHLWLSGSGKPHTQPNLDLSLLSPTWDTGGEKKHWTKTAVLQKVCHSRHWHIHMLLLLLLTSEQSSLT